MPEFHHIPVLLDDVLTYLAPAPGNAYLDLTLGGAGHASAVAQKISPNGTLYGFDRDPAAQCAAQARLASFPIEKHFFQTSFEHFDATLRQAGIADAEAGGGFDCVLADFGLSSHQIDDEARGFSFHADAPLDMRMSQSGLSARDYLAQVKQDELADVLYQFGDIRQSRPLARKICDAAGRGEMNTTFDLARVCCSILGSPRPGKPHPATRVFQAIRIEINGEFDAIDAFLRDIPKWMKNNSRLAIIAFHRGEDRRVKEAMRRWQNPCTCPPQLPVCVCHKKQLGKILTKKPIEATAQELDENSRARSAKLRAFQFIDPTQK